MNSKGRILAVDDDDSALALLSGVLGEEGYQVQPADSGRLALISVAAQPPDLILLDLRMPGMDGFEVCRRIKETEAGTRIPVIFLSASREIEEWVEGLALGAVDFISKPFRREELLARVHAHLELGRLRTELEARVAQRTAELRNAIELLQHEVAERRHAEQALRESEQRFRHIANAAPVIIWTSGPDHCVNFRNEHAREFTGRTADQLAGDRWDEVVHPEDLQTQRRTYSERMGAREHFQFEYRIRRADGEYRHMLERGTPRILPNGEFAGYVGIVVDLTDVKRSQERAFEAQSLENLRVLSAGIAHDFSTLIGAIVGEADLASSEMAPDAPGRGSVERIIGVAKRAADIVHLLMTYAGDRSGTTELELTDVSSLVQEIVPHLKASILERAVIRTNLDSRLPSVWANSRQIRQVVLNTIINAVETLDGKNGIVTITSSSVELPEGRYVKLEVSDTGSVMNEDVRARVIDPYHTAKFPGRGLGIAAIQGIIRSHRGMITLRSNPGEGSTYEIVLPAAS
jgi:PAS domain S-box-containing protein